MISAAIVNFNEGEKLADCLESLKDFIDEIIIVDLGSTDNSKEVAAKFGAKFIHHDRVSYVELIRNFVISKTSGEWITILDPDERLTKPLKERLLEVAKDDKFVAVNIPRKNVFFGKWIAHTNWWPDRHVRFFKREKVKWSKVIHRYPEVNGQTLILPAREELAIVHFGYDSIHDFIERQNRYSTIEAENLFKAGVKFSFWQMIWKTKREFLVRYIKHRGFLDGFYGLALTILMMVYQLTVWVKLWEMEHRKKFEV